jgi:hypothetical protein
MLDGARLGVSQGTSTKARRSDSPAAIVCNHKQAITSITANNHDTRRIIIIVDEAKMAPISTTADCASWSWPAVILAVGVSVGGVVLHILSKRCFKSIRGRIEQEKSPRLDLGNEKANCERRFAWFRAVLSTGRCQTGGWPSQAGTHESS